MSNDYYVNNGYEIQNPNANKRHNTQRDGRLPPAPVAPQNWRQNESEVPALDLSAGQNIASQRTGTAMTPFSSSNQTMPKWLETAPVVHDGITTDVPRVTQTEVVKTDGTPITNCIVVGLSPLYYVYYDAPYSPSVATNAQIKTKVEWAGKFAQFVPTKEWVHRAVRAFLSLMTLDGEIIHVSINYTSFKTIREALRNANSRSQNIPSFAYLWTLQVNDYIVSAVPNYSQLLTDEAMAQRVIEHITTFDYKSLLQTDD